MIDIVIPYRDSKTDELKYTLRSIEKNFRECRIIISGDIPDWVQNVITMPREQTRGAQLDCELNIRQALPYLSDEFYLWNDDFILLRPVQDVPNYHEGDIDLVIKKKKAWVITSKSAKSLKNTADYLNEKGFSNSVAYTLHIPVKYNRDLYQECSDMLLPTLEKKTILPRTVYGNIYGECSGLHHDVKIYKADQDLPDDDLVATWEYTWSGIAGQKIREMFCQKSKYEI